MIPLIFMCKPVDIIRLGMFKSPQALSKLVDE